MDGDVRVIVKLLSLDERQSWGSTYPDHLWAGVVRRSEEEEKRNVTRRSVTQETQPAARAARRLLHNVDGLHPHASCPGTCDGSHHVPQRRGAVLKGRRTAAGTTGSARRGAYGGGGGGQPDHAAVG